MKPKKHHFLPQWLTKRWGNASDGDRVYGITKTRNGAPIKGFYATPKAIGWSRHLYSIKQEDGTQNADLEETFYAPLDDYLNSITKQIIEAIKKNNIPVMNDHDKKQIAHALVIDSARRDPDQVDVIEQAAQRPDFRANILARIPERYAHLDAETMYDQLTQDADNLDAITNKSRRALLARGVESLVKKPFRYLIAPPGKSFILGNPLLEPRRSYIVPIHPDIAIAFRTLSGPRLQTLSTQRLRKINQNTYTASSRVVARTPNLLRSLAGKRASKPLSFDSDTDR